MTEKWEYKVHQGAPYQVGLRGLWVKGDSKIEKEINQFGLEGWEAVGIHIQTKGNWILFKRRLPQGG